MATDKIKISAYLPEDLKRDAEALAGIEKRSLSNLIEVLLQQAVSHAKNDGRLNAPPSSPIKAKRNPTKAATAK